ncbi:MAG TPA: transcriptional regulator [Roseiarcus sp.]|nr:transcriptional regulator [Roseiarcus sp.]
MITGDQVKVARKLLGWSQDRLAGVVGVGSTTILTFEKGRRQMSTLDLTVMRRVLEDAGVEFLEGRPPRLKTAVKRATWDQPPEL